MSFAQFEREMIADRTRDKMGAARRKGKWVGGRPVLGYDIAPTGGKLTVNPEEAQQVRAIFARYLQHGSLEAVLADLQRRRWTTKSWRTRDGKEHPGQPFTKAGLERLLRNILYLGQVPFQGDSFAGEQEAIVDRPAKPVYVGAYYPMDGTSSGFHSFQFTIPGIQFWLCTGQRIPDDIRTLCSQTTRERVIGVGKGPHKNAMRLYGQSMLEAHKSSKLKKFLEGPDPRKP